MREAAGLFGPLGEQRRALAVIVEPELLGLGGPVEPIEIGVDHRQPHARADRRSR